MKNIFTKLFSIVGLLALVLVFTSCEKEKNEISGTTWVTEIMELYEDEDVSAKMTIRFTSKTDLTTNVIMKNGKGSTVLDETQYGTYTYADYKGVMIVDGEGLAFTINGKILTADKYEFKKK